MPRLSRAASALAALAVAAGVSAPNGIEQVALSVGSGAAFGPSKQNKGLVRRDLSSQIKGSSQLQLETIPASPQWTELIGYCTEQQGAVKRYGVHCSGLNDAGTPCEASDECFGSRLDGQYVQQGHGETTECYDVATARQKCAEANDCFAITTQNNVCGGQYRVTHGGPTLLHSASWQSYNLWSYVLDRSCLGQAGYPPVTNLAECKAKCLFECRGVAWSSEGAAAGTLGNDQCVIYEGGCDDSGAGTESDRAGMTFYKKPPLPSWAMVNWVHLSGQCEGYSFTRRYGTACTGTKNGDDCQLDAAQVTNLQECKARCVPDANDNECKAIAWLASPDLTKTEQCQTFYGACTPDVTGNLSDFVWYEKPEVPAVRVAGESSDSSCNSYSCDVSRGMFPRKEAPDIPCKSSTTCTTVDDENRCCKALSREVVGKKCRRAAALNWRSDSSLEECVFWAINNGAEFFAFGTGPKAERCWWQRSTAPPYCQGEACCHCGPAWEAHFTKIADSSSCSTRYGVEDQAGSVAGCATACRAIPGCTTFSYGIHVTGAAPNCRVAMCNDPATGTFPAGALHKTGACGDGISGLVDDDTKTGACGVTASPDVTGGAALYSIKVAAKTTYEYDGGEVQAGAGPDSPVTLTAATWPENYCVEFELTFPDQMNTNHHGVGGIIAFLGDTVSGSGLQISVSHSNKLYRTADGGNLFGLLARERGTNAGPFFGTVALAKPGDRKTAKFCYLGGAIDEPSWEVDGLKATADYVDPPADGTPPHFPSNHNVPLNLFGGDGNAKMADNAVLHSFKITQIEPCSMETDDFDFYKLA